MPVPPFGENTLITLEPAALFSSALPARALERAPARRTVSRMVSGLSERGIHMPMPLRCALAMSGMLSVSAASTSEHPGTF